jgi:uncharacterized membrane protein
LEALSRREDAHKSRMYEKIKCMKIDKKQYYETDRLETFSDGVFAIAITLLVLELIQMLHLKREEGLLKTFSHNWELFLAFFIGFVTILVCWINHTHALKYINKVDDKFMWVNGFLLFMVTLTPFPTAILAESIEADGRTSLLIFGFNYIMIALAAYFICRYAYNNRLVEESNREYFCFIKKTYGYSIFYTIVVFFICFISIPTAIALYIFMFTIFALPKNFATFLFNRKRRKIIMTKKAINRVKLTSANKSNAASGADTGQHHRE